MPERALMRLPQGIILVDSELLVDYANPAAERMLGVGSPGDPLPDPWPEFSLRELAASLFGPEPRVAGTLIETDHHFFWVEGVPQGTAETAILIVYDVTERERMRQSEREFVENAAHELRTPLAAIVSVMDVLEGGAKDVPETRDRFLRHIRVHSERLSRLATSLLVLARLQTGVEQPRLTVVPVQPLLDEIATRLDLAAGVEVSVRAPEQTGALVDRDLLHRAIANVAENSAKHTRAGEIVLEARGNGTTTEIEVRDTGPGMSEEEQERAFHRFYRSSNGTDGFGLGLAIAEEAIRGLGGTIELESEPGEGTRVRMVVPSAKITG
jgi:two-component system, OmpR family, phosphate regulon sensor histidine kinase PhoR